MDLSILFKDGQLVLSAESYHRQPTSLLHALLSILQRLHMNSHIATLGAAPDSQDGTSRQCESQFQSVIISVPHLSPPQALSHSAVLLMWLANGVLKPDQSAGYQAS